MSKGLRRRAHESSWGRPVASGSAKAIGAETTFVLLPQLAANIRRHFNPRTPTPAKKRPALKPFAASLARECPPGAHNPDQSADFHMARRMLNSTNRTGFDGLARRYSLHYSILVVQGSLQNNTMKDSITTSIAITQETDTRLSSAARLPAFAVLTIGLVVLYSVGFSTTTQAHNATHDTRHANGFPCH